MQGIDGKYRDTRATLPNLGARGMFVGDDLVTVDLFDLDFLDLGIFCIIMGYM